MAHGGSQDSALIGRVGGLLCAIPIAHVTETMRPLPIEPIGSAPSFVRGLAIIRGAPTPVVDTAALIGTAAASPTRFVIVHTGGRRVALTFDEVIDVRPIEKAKLAGLPPLLAAPEQIAAVGSTDDELLVLLELARVITPEAWAVLEGSR